MHKIAYSIRTTYLQIYLIMSKATPYRITIFFNYTLQVSWILDIFEILSYKYAAMVPLDVNIFLGSKLIYSAWVRLLKHLKYVKIIDVTLW